MFSKVHAFKLTCNLLFLQATAVVAEHLNGEKGPPPNTDGQIDRTAINNNKDLDVDLKKEEQSIFGSFFTTKDTTKKEAAAMEPPPPSIRPQSSLSERETMETEVISSLYFLFSPLVTYLTNF